MPSSRPAGFSILFALWAALASAQTTAVVTHDVNLRATPSTAQTPIRLLAPNETVTLITTAAVNGYLHVRTTQNEDGWVYRTFVTIGSTPPPPVATCGPGLEVVVHPSCPAVGMHTVNHQLVAYPADTDPGLRNEAKRHVPDPSCTPKPFMLDDARSLQNYIDNTFGDAHTIKTLFQPTRTSLQGLSTFDGKMGEGDVVRLSAYLVIAKDEGSESVNCDGSDGTDIHINVGPKSTTPSEYAGIVAEMIPQLPRPAGWDSVTLNRLAGKQVLLTGGLAYDNEHYVNDNPASPKSSDPKRFSLWEIHPITAFYVCPAGDGCDPTQLGQWMALTDWAKAHP